MFLNLIEALKGGDDLSIYDDTEAWPSLFDDFVEFENDKANQNVGGKSDLAKKNSFSLLNNNNEEDGGEEEGKK